MESPAKTTSLHSIACACVSLKRKRPPKIQIPLVLPEIPSDKLLLPWNFLGLGVGVFFLKGKKTVMEDTFKVVMDVNGNPNKVSEKFTVPHVLAIRKLEGSYQELLEAVEHERSFRFNPPRSARIFRHPTLGNLELPQLPVGANDTELEERILQHLAAAAAIGRTHHIGRREGQRSRSTTHGRSQFLVFSSRPEEPYNGSAAVSQAQRGENEHAHIANAASPSTPVEATREEPLQQFSSSQADHVPALSSGSRIFAANRHGNSFNNLSSASRSSSVSQDRAGPSDLHLFSESLKSRFNAVSTRYKESITKGTRGWKERLFSRSTSIADLGSEVRREVNAGIASVSRMMERLEARENNRASDSSGSNNLDGSSVTVASNHGIAETHGNTHLDATNVTSGPN